MVDLDLAGNPIEDVSIAPRRRARRAKPLDPFDPKTWHENEDLTPRLKVRLRLGGWLAWHVRKQGDRKHWGAQRAGIIEAVPATAAWGVLDWCCVRDSVLWIELKSEKGKLTEEQAVTALLLAKAGQEVAVLRPRHFITAHATDTDLVAVRLVQHERPAEWQSVLVQREMTVPDVLRL